MAAVTICSDFGAPQNKISHCFHCFPIYLPWSDALDAMILVSECWVLSPRFHSQESSPAPQFKSINSLVLSLLYGPTARRCMCRGSAPRGMPDLGIFPGICADPRGLLSPSLDLFLQPWNGVDRMSAAGLRGSHQIISQESLLPGTALLGSQGFTPRFWDSFQ